MLEQKVIEMVDKLAAKLGVAASKVWEWAMLQVRVEAVKSIIAIAIALALIVVGAILIKKMLTVWGDTFKDTDTPLCFTPYIVGIVAIMAFCAAVEEIMNLVQYLINPEYSAFQNIVSQLSQLK